MSESESEENSKGWREFIKDHSGIFALFLIGIALAMIGAILVFLWVVGNVQSTNTVPVALGLWTMGYLVTFILNLFFWEFVLIGIPVILAAIAAWQWYVRLPLEGRRRYRLFGRSSRRSSGGNAVSFLVFIAFCIKISLDGNWSVPFSSWTFDYLMYSFVTALVWVVIIFGIPILIGLIWWITRGNKMKG
jgi:hypothetical protein